MKSLLSLLTVILFMAGTLVLGPVYLLLYFSQQFFYFIESLKRKNYKQIAH